MQLFADCADPSEMKSIAPHVVGFTTNPTLMRAAGVSLYAPFVKECVETFPDHSLSFEVIADDLDTMRSQARKLASWGDQIFVKIPSSTTTKVSTAELVKDLTNEGVHVNVTAILTPRQVETFNEALWGGSESYLSIFAGRIADTGRDPFDVVFQAATYSYDNVSVLWASAREVLNIRQAYQAGADIITLTPDLLFKYQGYGKDLGQFSLETVQMFYRDALAAGLTL